MAVMGLKWCPVEDKWSAYSAADRCVLLEMLVLIPGLIPDTFIVVMGRIKSPNRSEAPVE